MANTPSSKLPQRIIELDELETQSNPHAIEEVLYPTATAGKWFTAIDYKTDDNSPINPSTGDPVDYGTKRIPMSRIALRDENGLIPPSMLPPYVQDVIYGKFIPAASTAAGLFAEFQTKEPIVPGPDDPDPDGTYQFKYRSPYVNPDQDVRIKDARQYTNVIWMDIEASSDYENMQFVFKGDNNTTFHGFTPLPSTKVIDAQYGIEVDQSDMSLSTGIAVKKPDTYAHTTVDADIGPTTSSVGFMGLNRNAAYMVTITGAARPKDASNMIASYCQLQFVYTENSVQHTISTEIDMASTEPQPFDLSFTYNTGNSTTLNIELKSDQSTKIIRIDTCVMRYIEVL